MVPRDLAWEVEVVRQRGEGVEVSIGLVSDVFLRTRRTVRY